MKNETDIFLDGSCIDSDRTHFGTICQENFCLLQFLSKHCLPIPTNTSSRTNTPFYLPKAFLVEPQHIAPVGLIIEPEVTAV
jgi:hypothetical protein